MGKLTTGSLTCTGRELPVDSIDSELFNAKIWPTGVDIWNWYVCLVLTSQIQQSQLHFVEGLKSTKGF